MLPPLKTTVETYNGNADPIGNGVQGLHNISVTDQPAEPTYYWAIVKTNDVGDPSTTDFVTGITLTVCHELVEQFVERNGSFEEVGDPATIVLSTIGSGLSSSTTAIGIRHRQIRAGALMGMVR
jgi:hypothetical protein